MSEYVKWCKSVEETARGSCKQWASRIWRYSETKLFKIVFLLDVKSRLFRTIHFLTISPNTYMDYQVFKHCPQFLSALKDGVSLRCSL